MAADPQYRCYRLSLAGFDYAAWSSARESNSKKTTCAGRYPSEKTSPRLGGDDSSTPLRLVLMHLVLPDCADDPSAFERHIEQIAAGDCLEQLQI
jgi:hypothetical protein